jgi:1-aminocyclopropane-1-carboxylate deaminase
MKCLLLNNIQIQKLSNSFTNDKVFVEVLRLDLLHNIISGNKFFKLRFFIDEALKCNKTITTFGGAFSNHIVATAYACKINKIPCKGIIRGEKPLNLSITLQHAIDYGMKLEFVNRKFYKQISTNYHNLNNELVIPEGGFGELGFKGAATINDLFDNKYNAIITAVGTGTTIAGLSANPIPEIIGINVLKGNAEDTIQNIKKLHSSANINLLTDYHFGGYAKKNNQLLQFMNWLYKTENLPSDFVYTGKMFYGLYQLIHSNYFKPQAKILAIHTGGLQGNLSLEEGSLIF